VNDIKIVKPTMKDQKEINKLVKYKNLWMNENEYD